MKTTVTIALALVCVMSVGASSAIAQDTFTFNVTNGVWNRHQNWLGPAGEKPEAGDTAIILTGQTCRVEDADQAAKLIHVQPNATLRLLGKSLTLGEEGAVTSAPVDGQIVLGANGTGVSMLLIKGTVQFQRRFNVGAIVGEDPNARITRPIDSTEPAAILVPSDFEVRGSLKVTLPIIFNYGTFLTNPGDVMQLGPDAAPGEEMQIVGAGLFEAIGGEMRFAATKLASSATWRATLQGTIRVTDQAIDGGRSGDVHVAGFAKLILEGDYKTTGNLRLSGGEIRVSDAKSAEFSAAP